MEKYKIEISIEIKAGAKLERQWGLVCEDICSTINAIICSRDDFKIKRLFIDKNKVDFDLICDHYPTDQNTKEDMKKHLNYLKNNNFKCVGKIQPYFYNENITVYKD